MLYSPPSHAYTGLTFILSKPSRFDTIQLISGYASKFFDSCLKPLTRFQCDIRTLEFHLKGIKPLLPNTKVVILLGEEASKIFIPNLSLNESRGCVYKRSELTYIST